MAITINVNGLTLCHRGSGGVSRNTLPDVCKTPPDGKPVPFSNIAYSKDLAKGSTTVFADGGNSCANYGSIFARSILDEPGSLGGIASGTFIAEAEWISHSFDVFIEGKPACRLTDKMFHNHRNTVNAAGLLQAHLSGYTGRDPLMKAACEVFCTVRQEGIDAKNRKPPAKRFDYSKRAKELSAKHPGLRKMSLEGKFLHAIDKAKKSKLITKLTKLGRKPVGLGAIKSRLLKQAMKKAGMRAAKRAAKKAFLKFIPVVNVISTAWDVYDVASTGYQVLKDIDAKLSAFDPAKTTTFEARPDMASIDPATGKPTAIYDYKFDRPAMVDGNGNKLPSYQDGWQKNGQKDLYDDMVGKDNVRAVNSTECKCKSK